MDLFQQKNTVLDNLRFIQGTLTWYSYKRTGHPTWMYWKGKASNKKQYQNLLSKHRDVVDSPAVLTRLHRDPLFWADQISDCCIVWHCLPPYFWTVEYLFHTYNREISRVKYLQKEVQVCPGSTDRPGKASAMVCSTTSCRHGAHKQLYRSLDSVLLCQSLLRNHILNTWKILTALQPRGSEDCLYQSCKRLCEHTWALAICDYDFA